MTRIIDLTLPVAPHFRWRTEFERERTHESGDLFQSTRFHMGCHGFTHVDAPVHFIPGGKPLNAIPLSEWIVDAFLIDLTDLKENSPISAQELSARGAGIREGEFAVLKTCWESKRSYETLEFWTEAPYLTRDGAEWLAACGASGVGFDFPSDQNVRDLVTGSEKALEKRDFAVHEVLLGNDMRIVEYLVNLHLVEKERVKLFIAPMNLMDVDGAPARAFVYEE